MKIIGQYITALLLFACTCHAVNAQYIDTVCAGDVGGPYRTSPRAGSVYLWTVQGGVIDHTTPHKDTIWVQWSNIPGIRKITLQEIDTNRCPGDPVEAFVLVKPSGNVNIFGPEQVCKGEDVILKATGADTYLWSTGFTGDELVVSANFDTTFSVIGFIENCKTNQSLHDLRVKYRPVADFTYSPDDPIIRQDIQFTYTGTNNVDEWQWLFKEEAQPGQYSDLIDPTHKFSMPGIKMVKLTVKNAFGCTDTITKYIVVEAGINVFIPTGFTPNNDGFNNIFKATYENILSAKMIIYDRWGEMLYTTTSMDEGWDGTYRGKAVPDGVFQYIITAVGADYKTYYFNGTVTLIR